MKQTTEVHLCAVVKSIYLLCFQCIFYRLILTYSSPQYSVSKLTLTVFLVQCSHIELKLTYRQCLLSNRFISIMLFPVVSISASSPLNTVLPCVNLMLSGLSTFFKCHTKRSTINQHIHVFLHSSLHPQH